VKRQLNQVVHALLVENELLLTLVMSQRVKWQRGFALCCHGTMAVSVST